MIFFLTKCQSVVFIISLLTISIQAEVYTAVTELEEALDVEKLHIEGLKTFVDFSEQHIKYFKWYDSKKFRHEKITSFHKNKFL